MKILQNIFKKKSQNFSKQARFVKERESKPFHPLHIWHVLFKSFFVIIIIILIINIFFFLKFSSGNNDFLKNELIPKETPVETVKREKLNEVLKQYEQKNILFESLKNEKPAVTDPAN